MVIVHGLLSVTLVILIFFGFAGTGRMVILQSVVVECFHCNMSWIYFHDPVDRVVVLLVGCQQTNRDYIKLPLS
jgi:hypothetical protein